MHHDVIHKNLQHVYSLTENLTFFDYFCAHDGILQPAFSVRLRVESDGNLSLAIGCSNETWLAATIPAHNAANMKLKTDNFQAQIARLKRSSL